MKKFLTLFLCTQTFVSLGMYRAALAEKPQALTVMPDVAPHLEHAHLGALTLPPTFAIPAAKLTGQEIYDQALAAAKTFVPEGILPEISDVSNVLDYCKEHKTQIAAAEIRNIENLLLVGVARGEGKAAYALAKMKNMNLYANALRSKQTGDQFMQAATSLGSIHANFEHATDLYKQGKTAESQPFFEAAARRGYKPAVDVLNSHKILVSFETSEARELVEGIFKGEQKLLDYVDTIGSSMKDECRDLVLGGSPVATFQTALCLQSGIAGDLDPELAETHLQQCSMYLHTFGSSFYAVELLRQDKNTEETERLINMLMKPFEADRAWTTIELGQQSADLAQKYYQFCLQNQYAQPFCHLTAAYMQLYGVGTVKDEAAAAATLKEVLAKTKPTPENDFTELKEARVSAMQLLRGMSHGDFELQKFILRERLGLTQDGFLDEKHSDACRVLATASKLLNRKLITRCQAQELIAIAKEKFPQAQLAPASYNAEHRDIFRNLGMLELDIFEEKRASKKAGKKEPLKDCKAWPYLISAGLGGSLLSQEKVAEAIFIKGSEIAMPNKHIQYLFLLNCTKDRRFQDKYTKTALDLIDKKEYVAFPFLAVPLLLDSEPDNQRCALKLLSTSEIATLASLQSNYDICDSQEMSRVAEIVSQFADEPLPATPTKSGKGKGKPKKVEGAITKEDKQQAHALAAILLSKPGECQDIPKAVEHAKKSADAKWPLGCYIYGLWQIKGKHDVEKNIKEGFENLKLAYSKNIPFATVPLAKLCWHGAKHSTGTIPCDPEKAFELLADCTTLNDIKPAEVCALLAKIGLKERCWEQNWKYKVPISDLLENLRFAQLEGNSKAALLTWGSLYQNGSQSLGFTADPAINQDFKLAIAFYQDASEKGSKKARLALACLKYAGKGMEEDREGAKQEMLEIGTPLAKFTRLYYTIKCESKPTEPVMQELQELVDLGNVDAMCLLGNQMIVNRNLFPEEKQIQEGVQLTQRAIELGAISNGKAEPTQTNIIKNSAEQLKMLKLTSQEDEKRHALFNRLYRQLGKTMKEAGCYIDFMTAAIPNDAKIITVNRPSPNATMEEQVESITDSIRDQMGIESGAADVEEAIGGAPAEMPAETDVRVEGVAHATPDEPKTEMNTCGDAAAKLATPKPDASAFDMINQALGITDLNSSWADTLCDPDD